MLRLRTLFALALFVPLLATSLPAQAAKAKVDVKAARAECFRQANQAVNSLGFTPTTADKNAAGIDAYRACCRKAGLAP
jgi:hypothetical protein